MLPVRKGFLSAILLLLWITTPAFAFKCNINATGLAFGTYDVFSPVPTDSTGTVSVDCNIPPQNPQAPLAVTISLSPGASGSFAPRHMLGTGATRLNYNLFTTASFSTIWGDGGGSSSTQTAFVTKDSPFSSTIYGRIPARQNASVGTYSDVITATIFW